MKLILSNYLLMLGLPLIFANEKTLTTSVYYEALCPDSRNFFINQFANSYINDKVIDKINLELIPFGKAILNQTTNEYNCEFDANWESTGVHCRANTLHLCIVNLYFDGQSDANKQKVIQLINCTFAPAYWRSNYSDAISECHQQLYNTNAQPIFNCYDTRKRELLDAAARVTALLNPLLDYVPWITFRYFKEERQKDFELHFNDSVNNVLPGTRNDPTCESSSNLIASYFFVTVFAIFITIVEIIL